LETGRSAQPPPSEKRGKRTTVRGKKKGRYPFKRVLGGKERLLFLLSVNVAPASFSASTKRGISEPVRKKKGKRV